MHSEWIKRVLRVMKRDGCTYKDAMQTASRERKGEKKTDKRKTHHTGRKVKRHRGSKKGDKSKTHPGDLDYTTKGHGDKDYHEGGHDVKKKNKPYTKGTVHIIN